MSQLVPEARRRLVSLLWYVPLLVQWQVQRLQETRRDLRAYAKAASAMTDEVERFLAAM